jgi:hypothetical protein
MGSETLSGNKPCRISRSIIFHHFSYLILIAPPERAAYAF